MSEITLEALLLAKEDRVIRQKTWLDRSSHPLISLTLVTPGAEKESAITCEIMSVALEVLPALFLEKGWRVVEHDVWWLPTGAEAFFVIADGEAEMAPQVLKKALIECEESHPLGRLWDIDVIVKTSIGDNEACHYRSITRGELGIEPRQCFICHEPAKVCARSGKHTLMELQQSIERKVNEYTKRTLI